MVIDRDNTIPKEVSLMNTKRNGTDTADQVFMNTASHYTSSYLWQQCLSYKTLNTFITPKQVNTFLKYTGWCIIMTSSGNMVINHLLTIQEQ